MTDKDVFKLLDDDIKEKERALYDTAPTDDLDALDKWREENADKRKEIEDRKKELARRKALLNLK